MIFNTFVSGNEKLIKSIFPLYRDGQKKLYPKTKCHNFFLQKDNNLTFLPFFYNDILRRCLKFYNEILRSNKMTAI